MNRIAPANEPSAQPAPDPNKRQRSSGIVVAIGKKKHQQYKKRNGIGHQVPPTGVEQRTKRNPEQTEPRAWHNAEPAQAQVKNPIDDPNDIQQANEESAELERFGQLIRTSCGHVQQRDANLNDAGRNRFSQDATIRFTAPPPSKTESNTATFAP